MSDTEVSNNFKNVTHVIFDMDGLLLDTETLYTINTQNIVKQFGKTYGWDAKVQILGLGPREIPKRLVELLDLPISADELGAMLRAKHEETLPNAQLMPGAERLVNHLYENCVPIGIATSSSKETYEMKTRKHKDFFAKFNPIVTGGSDPEVKSGKPNPDVFLVCAKRFTDKPKPESCLVFEDAPNGVSASLKAGMQVVMVPDQNVKAEFTKDATVVLRDLSAFKPEWFGLPAYK